MFVPFPFVRYSIRCVPVQVRPLWVRNVLLARIDMWYRESLTCRHSSPLDPRWSRFLSFAAAPFKTRCQYIHSCFSKTDTGKTGKSLEIIVCVCEICRIRRRLFLVTAVAQPKPIFRLPLYCQLSGDFRTSLKAQRHNMAEQLQYTVLQVVRSCGSMMSNTTLIRRQ